MTTPPIGRAPSEARADARSRAEPHGAAPSTAGAREACPTSRIPRFYELCVGERLARLEALGVLDAASAAHLRRGGGLDVTCADAMSENVVATHGLPLSVALNFRVNGRDVLVPMAVEEPSVVAAASNAARMVRESGSGFEGRADQPIMTAQVELYDVPDAARAKAALEAARVELLAEGDRSIPSMVARGYGCRDLDVRVLDAAEGIVVVHVHVDVGDAMGANVVDTVAEAIAGSCARLSGGTAGLRILTNLPLRRMVRVRCFVADHAVGGADVATAIARASRFAELDPFRAVTHNKGFMNGLDAAAVALGQDWRSIEAGAHGFAASSGAYRPLSLWTRVAGGLEGHAELPLAVGTVGGCTRAHPGVRAAMRLCGVSSGRELAVVLAAAGLASNLAALRALSAEGIQKGHMRLHERKRALEGERA